MVCRHWPLHMVVGQSRGRLAGGYFGSCVGMVRDHGWEGWICCGWVLDMDMDSQGNMRIERWSSAIITTELGSPVRSHLRLGHLHLLVRNPNQSKTNRNNSMSDPYPITDSKIILKLCRFHHAIRTNRHPIHLEQSSILLPVGRFSGTERVTSPEG